MMRTLLLLLVLSVSSQFIWSQEQIISGTVKDESGQLLPGVTVVVEGTVRGGITDLDGKFSIRASTGEVLAFSYVGYETQMLEVGNQTQLEIILVIDKKELEEIIVVGYGIQKKESVVGAIGQTQGEDLKRAGGVSDLSQALSGNVAGITTIQNSGRPGDESADIFIRGRSTWQETQPLILIDGVQRSDIGNIDPNEIESLSILKDASATAVFGVEGANGVILINTKRGQLGKTKLSIEANTTVKQVSKIYRQIDLTDALRYKNLAIEHELGANPSSFDDYIPYDIIQFYNKDLYPDEDFPAYSEMYPNVDWPDVMLNDYATSQKVNARLTGGTNFVKYFASVSYLHEGDIMNTQDLGRGYDPSYKFDRYNFRSNLDFDLTKTTRFSVNLSGYFSDQKEVKSGVNYKLWSGIYGFPSDLYKVHYDDGVYGQIDDPRLRNPFVDLNRNGTEHQLKTKVYTDYTLKQKLDFITKGLSLNAQVSLDYSFHTERKITDNVQTGKSFDFGVIYADTADRDDYFIYLNENLQNNNYYLVEDPITRQNETTKKGPNQRQLVYKVQLNYSRSFGKNNVTAMGAFKRRENNQGSKFPVFREDWVGRLTYNYDRRYLLELNGAYDGSDNFAPGYRFDFFPSLALGWTISNEKIIKDNLGFINMLKVRGSIGITGNDKFKPEIKWPYAGSYGREGNNDDAYRFGHPSMDFSSYGLYYEETIANANLQWEESRKRNVGLEYGFLNNLISGSFDLYSDSRTKIFLAAEDRGIPIYTGYVANPAGNVGKVDSWGWEYELKLSKTFANQFHIWSKLTIAHNENEILFKEDPEFTPDYQKDAGYQLGQSTSLITDNIMQNWDDVYGGVLYESNDLTLPGDFRMIDFNADGIIDDRDVAPIGYSHIPQRSYATTIGAEFKGVSFLIMFHGTYNASRKVNQAEFSGQDNRAVLYNSQVNHTWSPEDNRTEDATYHALRFRTRGASSAETGNYYLYDASYLRLKNIELAYTFTAEFLKKASISNLRVYMNGNNLKFWSDMPEDRENSPESFDRYPMMKRYNFGLNITF